MKGVLQNNMFGFISSGLLLGLSTGMYCLGACLPLLFPYLVMEKRGFKENALMLIEFSLGRLLGYVVIGLLAGLIGMQVQSLLFKKILAVIMIFSAILLIMVSVGKSFPHLGFCRLINNNPQIKKSHFIFGLLIGINICPPFVVGVSYVVQLGSICGGILFFLGFFIGSTLFFLPLLGSSWFSKKDNLRTSAAVSAMLAGLWFLGYGIFLLLTV